MTPETRVLPTDDRLLTLKDVAERYAISVYQATRHLKKRTGRLPVPCQERPWKFRASDVAAHMAGMGIVKQRQVARKHQLEAAHDADERRAS